MVSRVASTEFRLAVLDAYELEEHELVTLARACAVLDHIEALEDDINDRGIIVRGVRGGLYSNPSLKEMRAAESSFLAILKALGLEDADQGSGNRSSAARALARQRWGVRR